LFSVGIFYNRKGKLKQIGYMKQHCWKETTLKSWVITKSDFNELLSICIEIIAFYPMNIVLQPLRWCCVDCVIHHERDVREEQKYICVARASNNKREIATHDLHCCLLSRCDASRTFRSGFPIATIVFL